MTPEERINLTTQAALLFGQKILTVKPIKGGIAVDFDPRPAWDAAEAFVKEKERRESEQVKSN